MKIISKFVSGIVIASLFTYYASPVMAYLNEETIYSNLDNNGKKYNSSVTTVLEDKDGTKIEQNEINKDLPIETKITYYLNGEEIKANKIAGQSGRVKIDIHFENKAIVEDMYVPFVVIVGLSFDNDNVQNIKISNGKILTNGNKTIAVGYALPGMQENLDIDELNIPTSIEITFDTNSFELGNIMIYANPKLLSEFDISMSDFSEVFDMAEELKLAAENLENGGNSLAEGMLTLDEGINELLSGTNELNNGANTLKNGVGDLVIGVNNLNDGANTLNLGAQELSTGANEYANKSQEFNLAVNTVSNGLSDLNLQYSQLDNGILDLQSGVESLSGGASKIDSGLGSTVEGVQNLDNGINALIDGINQVNGGINNIIENMENSVSISEIDIQIAYIESQKQGVDTQLEQLMEAEETGMADETTMSMISILTGFSNSLQSNIDSLYSTKELYNGLQLIKNGIEADDGLLNGANAIKNGIEDPSKGLLSGVSQLKAGTENLISGVADLSNGTDYLKNGSSQVVNGIQLLDSGSSELADYSEQLSNGALQISSGANALAQGTIALNTGTNELAIGATSLQTGTNALENGTKSLNEGVQKLADGGIALVNGSKTLSDGIKQFNEQGIDKIYNLINTDAKNLIRKVEKLERISSEYESFASKDKRDDIKFISITDSIKLDNSDTKKESKKK